MATPACSTNRTPRAQAGACWRREGLWGLIAALWSIATPALAQAGAERTYFFDDGTSYTYTRPSPFGWLGRGVLDLAPLARETVKADNAGTLAALLAGTALLVHYDQDVYDETSQFGRRRGISQDATGSSFTGLPRNFGNYMYFIGDGRVPVVIAGGLLAAGSLGDDVRMLSTASQLAEVMVSTGIVCQGLKQTLGRETPESRSKDGGEWHGPQNLAEYARHETRYDAMPSGHLATAVATITVLAENYHEHETAIYSGGGVLMAMLGFQMVNNGVHWAGDYPFGAAIGYALGRIVVRNNRRASGPGAARAVHLTLLPTADGLLLGADAQF